MKINFNKNEGVLNVKLEGRLDTTTAPEFDGFLTENLMGTSTLIIDCSELAYVSSAGLRVLLSSQKQMNKQGEMVIRNVRPEIMEIFDVTGFSDILTIE